MEEFFFRAVERVGFPIAVSVGAFWAVFKLFQMRELDRNGMLATLITEAKSQTSSLASIDTHMQKQSLTLAQTGEQICQMNAEQKQLCQADVVSKATDIAVKAAMQATTKIADVDRQTELRHHEATLAQIEMAKAKLEHNEEEIQNIKARFAEAHPS